MSLLSHPICNSITGFWRLFTPATPWLSVSALFVSGLAVAAPQAAPTTDIAVDWQAQEIQIRVEMTPPPAATNPAIARLSSQKHYRIALSHALRKALTSLRLDTDRTLRQLFKKNAAANNTAKKFIAEQVALAKHRILSDGGQITTLRVPMHAVATTFYASATDPDNKPAIFFNAALVDDTKTTSIAKLPTIVIATKTPAQPCLVPRLETNSGERVFPPQRAPQGGAAPNNDNAASQTLTLPLWLRPTGVQAESQHTGTASADNKARISQQMPAAPGAVLQATQNKNRCSFTLVDGAAKSKATNGAHDPHIARMQHLKLGRFTISYASP